MPTIFSNAAAALAISAPFGRELSWRARVLGVIGAVAPDADVVGFRFGIHYGDMLGHRGLSHSLFFAAGLALVFMFRLRLAEPPAKRWTVWMFLFLAITSHGVLDAFTDGGLGVAFFAPFDSTRYFFPVTPIEVSPIGVGFFSAHGLRVICNEMLWVWPPCLIFASVVILLRKFFRGQRAERQSTPEDWIRLAGNDCNRGLALNLRLQIRTRSLRIESQGWRDFQSGLN